MSVAMWFDRDTNGIRHLQSDWGRIEYTYARFDRDPIYVGSTILTTEDYAAGVFMFGPRELKGSTATVEIVGDRMFWHADAHGQRWTWELFPAHFVDEVPRQIDFMLGRWPD